MTASHAADLPTSPFVTGPAGDKTLQFITLGDALRAAAARYRDRPALVVADGTAATPLGNWTYREVLAQAERVARALLQLFQPGSRVAIWAQNGADWYFVEFGAALAGLTLVTVNPALGERELIHVLRQSGAAGILLQDRFRGRDLAEIVKRIRHDLPNLATVIPLSRWTDMVAAPDCADVELPHVSPNDIAQIQYTSGTTGAPKGACLTHLGLLNSARLYAERIGAGQDDVWINPMPMFHTAGCGLVTLGTLQTGGLHVLPDLFDAEGMLDLFERYHGTIILGVPTMLIRMLDSQQHRPRDVSHWRLITLGGAPVAPELVRRASDMIGARVAIGYGQTETSPYLTHTYPEDPHPQWAETVGFPLPHTEIRICDPVGDQPLPVGIPGEIRVRGYGVMVGYYNDRAATTAAFDADGWLRTGDIGRMDEAGYFRIEGRLKDMIIRGGENIYPREVEDVLFEHSAVGNVAVLGMPDPEWGERVVACVQLRANASANAEELAAFCRDRLAGFKVPRDWRFLDALPQTASGKVQKFVLRDMLLRDGDTLVKNHVK